MINFPATNISSSKWDSSTDPFIFIIDSPIISGSYNHYLKYYHHELFVDSVGKVFIVEKMEIKKIIRDKLFHFLKPKKYQIKLTFQPHHKKISIEWFKKYFISKLQQDVGIIESTNWVKDIQKAKTFREIMGS